ncbi:hypothetical protein L1D34_29915, partial [Vibrio mediterranei]|uniref:tetratricopeptide repeat protein n=1 Tax=Vibrio mediterranei TaxID=689 RepID=UPI001EFD1B30
LDKEQKNDFRINALLASYYYSINDIENAKLKIDAAKEKVQSRVDKSELFALSGKIYIANNELELAKKDLKKALEFGYDQSIIKNNLAIIAIKGNDLNKAFDLLSSEYQLNTDDKDIATNLALVLIKTKHQNKAKTILMKTFGEIKGVEYFNRLTAKKHTEPTIKTKPLSNHITTMKPASSPKQYIDLTGQYEVQVIAKLNTLTDADKYFLKSISKDWLVFEVDHVKKYCLGPYSDMNSAKNAAEQIDIEGAFVVNYGSIPYKELHL